MNRDPNRQRTNAPEQGQRRPSRPGLPPQNAYQTRRPAPMQNGQPPQSAYRGPGLDRPTQNRVNAHARPSQSQPPRRPSYPYPPQTINRPPRPYGEMQPPRRQTGVRMQVQSFVPPGGTRYRRRTSRWPRVLALILALALVIGAIIAGTVAYRRWAEARDLAAGVRNDGDPPVTTTAPPETTAPPPETTDPPVTTPPGPAAVLAVSTSATRPASNKVESPNAIVIDLEHGFTVAERMPDERIYPASMTKVMTLIVAYEEIRSFDATYTFSHELINPLVTANASRAGFCAGETVPVIDLFYGAALPSGGDATAALAELVAGSEAAFADRMNAKAAAMGLRNTHFTNASGLHDKNHYSTVREIAAIFAYAMQIEPLREILSTYRYTTAKTEQNPEGLELTSTLFAYVSGDELPGMRILAGKTGYTIEAKRCLVTLGLRDDGREYIAVTVGGENKWIPITDAVELYAMCLDDAPTPT